MASGRMVALACLTLGCAPGSTTEDGPIALVVAPVVVPAGDSVTVTLTTTVAGGVGYNLCSSTLEHRLGYDWTPVPVDRVCTMELRTLLPGEEATFTFQLSPTLAPGEYRYHARVESIAAGEMRDVRTEPFRLR